MALKSLCLHCTKVRQQNEKRESGGERREEKEGKSFLWNNDIHFLCPAMSSWEMKGFGLTTGHVSQIQTHLYPLNTHTHTHTQPQSFTQQEKQIHFRIKRYSLAYTGHHGSYALIWFYRPRAVNMIVIFYLLVCSIFNISLQVWYLFEKC